MFKTIVIFWLLFLTVSQVGLLQRIEDPSAPSFWDRYKERLDAKKKKK